MVGFAALTLETTTENAFLLTRQWRDASSGIEIVFWARGESGPIRIRLDRKEAVAFAERGRLRREPLGCRVRPVELRTFDGDLVDALYFESQRALVDARRAVRERGERLYESDLKPADRFLMEHFVTGGFRVEGDFVQHPSYREYRNPKLSPAEYRPRLTVLSLDIETDGLDETLCSVGASEPKLRNWFHFLNSSAVARTSHEQYSAISWYLPAAKSPLRSLPVTPWLLGLSIPKALA